jgi:adenylate cyclase
VRIEAGGESLPPPGFAEAKTLAAIGAPPGVRLACQIRPRAALTVTRLVAPPLALGRVRSGMESDAAGVERHLAVMFVDLKGFTARAEKQLPYDVVFLLNRVFRVIGEVIVAEGGWVDKYMGDGMLAVFGRETGLAAGSRAALRAAARINVALDALNAELAAEGSAHVGVGIGIHAGRLVVGRVGYGEAAQVTVIGETVNLASRLQELTRGKSCELIVSRELVDAAGWSGAGFRTETVTPRGTVEPLEVLIVPRARDVVLEG